MKTFSAYNDDGITLLVLALNAEEAAFKTTDKIAEIGYEFDLNFFEDDIDDAFVSDDETVREWLDRHGVGLSENIMLIMECNDIEQNVQVVNL